jgi:membrane protein implicated in regulation of membrane protease activity
MIRFLKRFGLFWYDFVVGDDWVMAAGVLVAIGVTWLLSPASATWLIMPFAIAAFLALSLARAVHSLQPRRTPTAKRRPQ